MGVTCPYCSREFKGDKLNARHLNKCNPAPPPPPCLCGHGSTSLTQMKRHRRTCEVWQGRDKVALANERRRQTSLKRYGVEDARRTSEADAKREATNLERYGASNPLARESSVFDKVQASLEGKRPGLQGADNPFAKPEVQAKIRATMLERHGAVNPQQVSEIRARTRTTNLKRYGGELLGSLELAAKARVTNKVRYGDAFPQRTEAVKARQQVTNMERYGVPWSAMNPEVRRKQLATMEAKWGSHFFASDEGKKVIRQAMLDKYGVEHWMQREGAWDELVAIFRERFGVDHPLQLEEFRAKQRATNIARHGTPFPGLWKNGPNLFEQRVGSLAPAKRLLYTGDGSWWRRLPKLGKHKNPDFIVPGPDPKNPKKGVTKVVEAFGDFWHSRMFTGKAPFEHEQELIDAFADIGIDCLVIWESEVRGKGSDPEAVRERLSVFLG